MEYCEVPAYVSSPCDFCYIMPDDSMNLARVFKGDLLCFREADSVEFGKIAAVVVDGELYIRKVYQLDSGSDIILTAIGSVDSPVAVGVYNAADIQIMGLLVESHHRFISPAATADDGCKSCTSAEIEPVTK